MEVNNKKFVKACHRCVEHTHKLRKILERMESLYKDVRQVMLEIHGDREELLGTLETEGEKDGQEMVSK